MFERLLTNFTWWVNRKDPDDRNLFQGGFLGLDNIGIFDRSAPLPGGGTLEQADGTAWMALYCQWMLQIAVELAKHDAAYADMALKFVTHFEWIAIALDPPGGDTVLWDEDDGFYYDVMRMPDGADDPAQGALARGPAAAVRGDRVRRRRDRPQPRVHGARRGVRGALLRCRAGAGPPARPEPRGPAAALARRRARLRRILAAMLDEEEFLGPHGIRAISRRHLEQPCVFEWGGQRYEVHYLPAESDTGMFGGNSNWRGPVWFPMNLVILRGLLQLYGYYGERLTVECPTGSGRQMNLLRGRDGDQPAADHRRSPRTSRGAGRCSAGRSASSPTRTGTTCCSSTSTSTATTAPASARATRPDGPAPWRCSSCWPTACG